VCLAKPGCLVDADSPCHANFATCARDLHPDQPRLKTHRPWSSAATSDTALPGCPRFQHLTAGRVPERNGCRPVRNVLAPLQHAIRTPARLFQATIAMTSSSAEYTGNTVAIGPFARMRHGAGTPGTHSVTVGWLGLGALNWFNCASTTPGGYERTCAYCVVQPHCDMNSGIRPDICRHNGWSPWFLPCSCILHWALRHRSSHVPH
jgi:hypothetical protein